MDGKRTVKINIYYDYLCLIMDKITTFLVPMVNFHKPLAIKNIFYFNFFFKIFAAYNFTSTI